MTKDQKVNCFHASAMVGVFTAVLLGIGLTPMFTGEEANPSPEQWIAAAHDLGDKTIANMDGNELQITSTAMQAESSQALDLKATFAVWALGVIAGAVVVRVAFVDILGWERKRT